MRKRTYALPIPPIGDAVLENIDATKLCLVFPGIIVFVKKSSRLNFPGIHTKGEHPQTNTPLPCGKI